MLNGNFAVFAKNQSELFNHIQNPTPQLRILGRFYLEQPLQSILTSAHQFLTSRLSFLEILRSEHLQSII